MQREELYLQDILESIAAIENFLKNVEEDEFLASELLQSAVFHKLTVIGEASARLSDKLKEHYPETPWKKIIGLRNIVVHAYFSVNWKIIWSTVQTRLKPLREEVTKILQNEFPDFDLREKE